ncbi:MAG: Jag N-terminal domain-containing protein [Desulfovibrionaceae bacterium]|nr:Jag N-terminal domain-containing protein [Desulfovibrionaceae bacterium]
MKGAKEFTGRSLDEAIEAACKYYDLPREKLEVEIINDSKTGIFGIVGAKKAKILAKQVSVEDYAPDLSREKPDNEQTGRAYSEEESPGVEPRRERSSGRQIPGERTRGESRQRGRENRRNSAPASQVAAPDAEQSEKASVRAEGENPSTSVFSPEKRSQEPRSRSSRQIHRARGRDASRNRDRSAQFGAQSEQTEGPSAELTEVSAEPRLSAKAPREGRSSRFARSRRDVKEGGRKTACLPEADLEFSTEPLQEDSFDNADFPVEFDVADANLRTLADVNQEEAMSLVEESLNELLKPICDQAEIDVRIEDGRIEAVINNADESGLIIGREGQTLSALQYMVSRIISRRMEAAIHVHLDTGEYKERQEQKLRDLALRLAERARESGRTQYTRPLSSYHRRIIHMLLQEEEGIETRSKGEGAMKRVYIFVRRPEQAD